MNLGPYAKAVNNTAITLFTGIIAASADGGISTKEWIGIAITTIAALVLVFQADNRRYEYAKAIAAVLTAALGTLGVVATGGLGDITWVQWLMVLVAALGSLVTTSQTPNAVQSDYRLAA